ncbi:helix-turn-helix domain-containing protein [Enterobacter ludwigii]
MFSKSIYQSISEMLHKQLPCEVSKDNILSISGYSRKQLDRIFIKNSGVTFFKYIELVRLYKIAMELKFTTISVEGLCAKYGIKNKKFYIDKFNSIMGVTPSDFRKKNNIDMAQISKKINIHIRCDYLKCTYVSIFNYNVTTMGIKEQKIKPFSHLFSSHHHEKEDIIKKFRESYNVSMMDIWLCSKFSPYNSNSYCFEFVTCVNTADTKLECEKHLEPISLQGDYLLFEWIGKIEDPHSIIKNIYGNFFLKHGIIRKDGYDIERRQPFTGICGNYVFSYYIPIVLNTSILDIITNYNNRRM